MNENPNEDESRFLALPLGALVPHPANPNVMDDETMRKLRENVRRQGEYPPLIVRPHPTIAGSCEILDGHQRAKALRDLGYATARCYLWPCDDEQALILLGTLNRLHGEDEPYKRAELLAQLAALMSAEDLAQLLPEDAGEIERALASLDLDVDRLLAELGGLADGATSTRTITFVVLAEDEPDIERAVIKVTDGLVGSNRRGRALAALARRYLSEEASHA